MGGERAKHGLHAVILAGGRGVRLWPLSRESRGKQFLPLAGEVSLLRQTALRLLPLVPWDRTLVVLEASQHEAAAAELPELRPDQFLLEPERRNTAAAIALAAKRLVSGGAGGDVMLVAPADHAIGDEVEFRHVVQAAAQAAEDDSLVTIGMRPTRPETGYGYIEVGPMEAACHEVPVHRALSFVEKPSVETAQELVRGGRHLWNSGMFLWRVEAIQQAIATHMPALAGGLAHFAPADCRPGHPGFRAFYASLDPVSIDYGVMEKAESVAVVPGDFGWNDLGSWRALDEVWPGDAAGNRARGELRALGATGITLFGGGRPVVVVGARNLVIVDTPDVLLVCDKEHAQKVKDVVADLEAEGRRELL